MVEGVSEEFKQLIEDLELLGLVEVEGEAVSIDFQSAANFIIQTLLTILRAYGVVRDIMEWDDEDILYSLIMLGLILRASSRRLKAGGEPVFDDKYIINLTLAYLSVLLVSGFYDRLLELTRLLADEVRREI